MRYLSGMRTIFIAGLLLAGCSVSPKQFVGPNGVTAYSMRCSGLGRSLYACYRKAGEICPSGYANIDRSSSVFSAPTTSGILIGTHQSLAIECR